MNYDYVFNARFGRIGQGEIVLRIYTYGGNCGRGPIFEYPWMVGPQFDLSRLFEKAVEAQRNGWYIVNWRECFGFRGGIQFIRRYMRVKYD